MDSYSRKSPKYYRIYEDLLKKIHDGEFEENDRFPSDTELVKEFDVSRGTVREAVKMLLMQGYLVRKQGKGTFVTYKKIEQDSDKLIGFSELMKRHNIKPTAKVVSKEITQPPGEIKRLMQLQDSDKVVHLIRVRYGDDLPLIIERSYFNYKFFKPIYSKDLENNSIFGLLYQHTDTKLGEATQRIEAMSTAQEEAELLNVPINTPLLLLKRLIQTKSGEYFQYSEDVYRSDRIGFTTRTSPYYDDHNDSGLPIDIAGDDLQEFIGQDD